MEEARSLSYGITISAATVQAEEGIRNLSGMLGRLRAEAEGDVDIAADTEQASENIRGLAGDIGRLQSGADSTEIVVDADTTPAEESILDLTGEIGSLGERSADVDVALHTEQAQTDLQRLEDRTTNLGHDPPDIKIDIDTAEAERNIRDLTDDIGHLSGDAGSIGSAFRKSFLAGVDSGNSFSSVLRSGVGGAVTHIGERVTDLKDNVVTKMGDVKESVVSGAKSIKEGFTHPIETIKNGLGGAIDHAKSRFTDFVRGANDAADAADDVGDAAGGARPEVEDLGDAAETSGSKFEKFGGILGGFGKAAVAAVTAATVAIGGFAAASVNTGMEFDSSMSQVAATMGYTIDELNDSTSEASQNFSQLREFAMEMGANTAFSASQSADALNYMALAGYDAETSMAMLPNVLNLAAAGGMELASASDMVTDAQSALGLTLDETSELVDKMAKASSKSNTSVAQLGEAILTVGGTAKTLSGGTTELNMALGVLADNGIKGAEGGTALRNMILSLSAPTDKAAAQLKALGVEAFDAEGNLRPLNETFGDLNGALSTMTQEEQTQALNEIFNKTDLKSVNAMLGTSAERFGELSESIADSKDAAEDMAGTQLDNLAGDITLFKSALEGAQIVISDELAPSLRDFTQFGTEAVTKLSEAFQEGGLTGAMGALGGILSDGLGMIIEMLPTAIDAGMRLLGALGQGLLDNMPVIIDAAIQIVTLLGDGILNSLPVLAGASMQIIASLASGIGGMLPELIPSIVETIVLIAGTLIENLPLVLDAGMQLLSGLADGIVGAVPILIEQLPSIISGIASTLGEHLPELVSTGMTLLMGLASGILSAIPQLVAQLPAIGSAIFGALGEIPSMVIGVGRSIVEGLWSGISSMGSWVTDQVKGFASGIVDGVKGFLGIHSPSTVFAEIGDNMALGLGGGFADGMKGVTEDMKGAIPTNLDGPEFDIPEPNGPSDMTYGVYPNVVGIDEIGNAVGDSVYKVRPVIEDINTPSVSDIYYNVNPLVKDFNPPGYENPTNMEGSEGDCPERIAGSGNGGTPEPNGGSAGNGGGFTFAPTLPPIQITIEGSADRETLEKMEEMLKLRMEEMKAMMRELYDEFREEELQRAALKNQYVF